MLTLELRIVRGGKTLSVESIPIMQGKVGIQCSFHPGQEIIDDMEDGLLALKKYEVTYESKFYAAETR